MKERVAVAMSGGVDSSVAAALLQKQGYEVIGITMCFGAALGGDLLDVAGKKPNCCGPQGIEDARKVAGRLSIKHYVLDFSKELAEKVIKNFCDEYRKGRTPNPCIRCNQFLKFDLLLKKALACGARYLATGHYARITSFQWPGHSGHYYLLQKAKDIKKDQSYFLYRLNQKQLGCILFPLGEYSKDEVRGIARKFHLSVAEKKGSQEICFLPQDNYRGFLARRKRFVAKPGAILDMAGKTVGQHKGVAFYTIGQREGLGLAMGHPVYVTRIDAARNTITIGSKEDASQREFTASDVHFIVKPEKKKIAAMVKIRYNHREMPAEIRVLKNHLRVTFERPEFAITPGQSAVIYDGDIVLGGAVIKKVCD
jgi:tRNA-specific 2-thiouridylase